MANLFVMLSTKFCQNQPGVIEHTTKTFVLLFLWDTMYFAG